jgi:serine phosphatase RsbU (regulator of sigma subunit)
VQPYLRTERGWEAITVGGYPLGASARANYTVKHHTLTPGASMVFISDGVIESQSPTGEFYGFERFEALLAKLPADATPDAIIKAVLNAVYKHLADEEPQDDITVVVLQAIPELVGVPA